MDLSTSKNLGGIGALLMFLGFVPYVSTYSYGILELVGVIMLLIAAKGLASYYNEGGIFNNAIFGVIMTIVGVFAFAVAIVFAVASLLGSFGFGLAGLSAADFTALTQIDWTSFVSAAFSDLVGFFSAFILALVVLFIFVVIAAVFYRKSMQLTARRTGVGLFGSAGTMVLVGAVLTIIGIGILLLWISLLLVAIAFFQIRSSQAAPPPPPPPM